ncbi:hypothetical protein FACS1894186_4030 [Alphaproteobacteria bacterium]|nr:hypothetical protein FACS1894186_4030 [Alphaproteobacteria bacterium]
MKTDTLPEELEGLDRAIARLDAPRAGPPGERAAAAGMGLAVRIMADLVGALAVGVGLGLLLDGAFESRPWCTVALTVIGAVAGGRNAYRATVAAGGAHV